jgi:hypothetical protein
LRRRLRFAVVVLISQILLVALGVSWFIHMMLIERYGSVYFIESQPVILWAEIIITAGIIAFAILVLIIQIKRLGERREKERDVKRQ